MTSLRTLPETAHAVEWLCLAYLAKLLTLETEALQTGNSRALMARREALNYLQLQLQPMLEKLQRVKDVRTRKVIFTLEDNPLIAATKLLRPWLVDPGSGLQIIVVLNHLQRLVDLERIACFDLLQERKQRLTP